MNSTSARHRIDLVRIATDAMLERGLEPAFPPALLQQLASITGPGRDTDPRIRDLTALPWCSLDNDDSLDLDQLTACEALADGRVKLFVAVADGDAVVKKDSAIDLHAWTNITSVYTSAKMFPMLPERLSMPRRRRRRASPCWARGPCGRSTARSTRRSRRSSR